ncbi:MAG: NADH-ubiquinone oxidoreductase, chain 49kDa [Proteobacteria bacterium]|nr:NADH-ubiquinone oxidoreductase, chain 49kDa [Pseudomonadota bacterium]
MKFLEQPIEFSVLAGAAPACHGFADAEQWVAYAQAIDTAGGRLVSLWGSDERDRGRGFLLHAAFAMREGLAWVSLPLAAEDPAGPDLGAIFPAAQRLQRALYDMLGIRSDGGDTRPWLRHNNWPADFFPLRRDADGTRQFPPEPEEYAFVRVEGDGVHEIPVGPIHAGIIEPGHFRFSIVGEKVLRLEERLGYKHKGIAKRFQSLPLNEGHRLAGRVSGDSTVAYAWAYCQAAESITACVVPERALWLRGLFLERERIANHLGDLGALGNDAALGFGLAQFLRLKENWLRQNQRLFGHRFAMDCVVPGGCACDIDPVGADRLLAQCDSIEQEVRTLKHIYDDHSGLQDRFLTTGRLTPKLAARLGVTGLLGRASGLATDLRLDAPFAPYDRIEFNMASHRNGDVAARVIVRFEEIFESLRLLRQILRGLPDGEVRTALTSSADGGLGVGWVEGWRGEILVALEAGPGGSIRQCHCHDPSWQNWPALEHAVIGNIVPDFPLINKSANLSYSGQDL